MTLKIPLFDGYFILSDTHQYILGFQDDSKMIHKSFYEEISDVVQAFIKLKIRAFNSNSIDSLTQSIKVLEERLSEALQSLQLKIVACGVEND